MVELNQGMYAYSRFRDTELLEVLQKFSSSGITLNKKELVVLVENYHNEVLLDINIPQGRVQFISKTHYPVSTINKLFQHIKVPYSLQKVGSSFYIKTIRISK